MEGFQIRLSPFAFTNNWREAVRRFALKKETVSTASGLAKAPVLTTTERDAVASPEDGDFLYNSTTAKFQGRAGGAWVDWH